MIIFKCSSVLADNKETLIKNATKEDWKNTLKNHSKGDHNYFRFTLVSNKCVTVDYGSWSDFFGVEGTEDEIKSLFPEFFNV